MFYDILSKDVLLLSFMKDDMKAKILIVEDDPLIRNELKTLLESNGYETAAPDNFSEITAWIKAVQLHLILSLIHISEPTRP